MKKIIVSLAVVLVLVTLLVPGLWEGKQTLQLAIKNAEEDIVDEGVPNTILRLARESLGDWLFKRALLYYLPENNPEACENLVSAAYLDLDKETDYELEYQVRRRCLIAFDKVYPKHLDEKIDLVSDHPEVVMLKLTATAAALSGYTKEAVQYKKRLTKLCPSPEACLPFWPLGQADTERQAYDSIPSN